MKKLLLTLALAFATLTAANAQIGIVGGWSTSRTNNAGSWDASVKNMSLWNAGLAYKFEIGPFFTIQPALIYQVKGTNVESYMQTLSSRSGFLELNLGLQLGLDLLALRPFILFEPFIGYQVYGNEDFLALSNLSLSQANANFNRYLADAKNKLEFGFGVGGGIELLNHLQVSAQWFMNAGQLYNGDKLTSDAVMSTVVGHFGDLKNYSGVKITLGLFF